MSSVVHNPNFSPIFLIMNLRPMRPIAEKSLLWSMNFMSETVSSLERRTNFPNLTDWTIKRKEVFLLFGLLFFFFFEFGVEKCLS